jgi:hypothetical protein
VHACQQLVEDYHLARVLDEVLVGGVGRTWLGAVEEVRVAGDFAELGESVCDIFRKGKVKDGDTYLHDHVHKSGLALLLAS